MKVILLLFLLISCGKYEEEKGAGSFPENNASAIETETFDKALNTIQTDFDQANIKVNLDSTRFSITNLGNSLGICYKEADGSRIGIALDHSLFEDEVEDDDEYGILYKVLLHEIGHCFFNREHDEARYRISGFDMLIRLYPNRSLQREDSFQQSLMSELGFFQVPKTIWPYYVKEIARQARIKTWEDISAYTEISIVPDTGLP